MRAILTALSIIAIIVASLYDNNYLIWPNEIVWSDTLKLTWGNFGGLELPGKTYPLQTELEETEHIGFLAQTKTDIVYSLKENSYDVKAVFYAGRSFYKIYLDTLQLSPYSLRHELYHFHITELYARYLRRDLAIIDHLSSTDVDSVSARYLAKADSASDAYDKFTRHANIIVNQKRMESLIDSLLLSTSNYKRR